MKPRAYPFLEPLRHRGTRVLGPSAVFALAGLMACAPNAGAPADEPNSGKNPHAADLKETLSWRRGAWPTGLRADPDWEAASRGESWALMRLGERRLELRQQLELGGPAAEVALRAWPLAASAWVERGVLCRALPRYAAEEWAPFLLALRESAASDDDFGEVLDPQAVSVCERTLELLDGRASDMTPSVFDQYAATCQAFERKCRLRTAR